MSLLLLLRSPATTRTFRISENTSRDFAGLTNLSLRQLNPTTSQNGLEYAASSYAAGDLTRATIKAALNALPAGGRIAGARLRLYQNNLFNTASSLTLLLCNREFVKTEATWNNYSTANAWATAGATTNTLDSDISNPNTFSLSTANTGSYVIYELSATQITALQAAYAAAGNINLIFTLGDVGNGCAVIWNRDIDADGTRPIFDIDYVAKTSTPSFLLMMLD